MSNIRNKVAVAAQLFEKVIDGNHQVDTTVSTISRTARLSRGIEIVAYDTNTDPVYVSRRSDVTADETVTGGFRLVPGSSVFFPAIATSEIFFISTAASNIGYLGY